MRHPFFLVPAVVLLLALTGCDLSHVTAYKQHMQSGRLDLARAEADTIFMEEERDYAKCDQGKRACDSLYGEWFTTDARLYRRAQAYDRYLPAAQKASDLLAGSLGKKHRKYLLAQYEVGYAHLFLGNRDQALTSMEEVRAPLMTDPRLGYSFTEKNMELGHLFEFYMDARAHDKAKQVVDRGLGYYNADYARLTASNSKAVLTLSTIWNLKRSEDILAFSGYLAMAAVHDRTMMDLTSEEDRYEADRTMMRRFLPSVQERANNEIIYAQRMSAIGKSSRALRLTNHAFDSLAMHSTYSDRNYFIASTNYASAYVTRAINNCTAVPYAHLDSIYSADCPRLYGRSPSEQRQYMNCQCGQAQLRLLVGAVDSAWASMNKATRTYNELKWTHERPENFAGDYATYNSSLFDMLLASARTVSADSLLRIMLTRPLTWEVYDEGLQYRLMRLSLKTGSADSAIATGRRTRERIALFRAHGINVFSVRDTRDVFGTHESVDALFLTALMARPGHELEIASVLDARKGVITDARRSANETLRTRTAPPEALAHFERLKAVRARITELQRSPTSTALAADLFSLEDTLYHYQRRLSWFFRSDARSDGMGRSEVGPADGDLWVDAHAVHMYDTASCSYYPAYLLLVRSKGVVPQVLQFASNEVDDRIEQINADHAQGRSSAEQLRGLSKLLLDPLETSLAKAKRVLVSGDGTMALLNWNMLERGGKPLVHSHKVVHVASMHPASASDMADFRKAKDMLMLGDPEFYAESAEDVAPTASFRSALVNNSQHRAFGGDDVASLPGSRKELDGISTVIGKRLNVRVLAGAEASENVIRTAAKISVLHLATHGFYERDATAVAKLHRLRSMGKALAMDPLLKSGLLLAYSGDHLRNGSLDVKGDDGLLTAADMAELDLSTTELVVLSACKTGQGDVVSSEGVDGLQTGVLLAGAKAVIVSYWPVDDAFTAVFMEDFYRNWSTTDPLAEDALRKTQRKFAGSKDHSSPYFWAAFNLVYR